MALNTCTLMGRLTANPELRHTTAGAPVTNFTIAVDRDFTDKQSGEKETDFIEVVAWRNTAEIIAESVYFGDSNKEPHNKNTGAQTHTDAFTATQPQAQTTFATVNYDDDDLPF